MAKMAGWVWAVLALVVLAGFQVIPNTYLNFTGSTTAPTGTSTTTQLDGGKTTVIDAGCNQNPSVTYALSDSYDNSIARTNGGTTQIVVTDKTGSRKPVVSSFATAALGDKIEYLVANRSMFMKPVVQTIGSCAPTVVSGATFDNSTGGHTYNVFDSSTGNVLTHNPDGGDTNLTIGSGGSANIEVYFQAPSRQASAPFGKTWCIEGVDTTYDMAQTKLSIGTAGASKPKAATLGAAANVIKCYNDATPYVDGSINRFGGYIKALSGQNPTVSSIRVHMVPMKYYLGLDGTFKLGTEDDDTNTLTSDYLYIIGID